MPWVVEKEGAHVVSMLLVSASYSPRVPIHWNACCDQYLFGHCLIGYIPSLLMSNLSEDVKSRADVYPTSMDI
jgi:hypothetical protein